MFGPKKRYLIVAFLVSASGYALISEPTNVHTVGSAWSQVQRQVVLAQEQVKGWLSQWSGMFSSRPLVARSEPAQPMKRIASRSPVHGSANSYPPATASAGSAGSVVAANGSVAAPSAPSPRGSVATSTPNSAPAARPAMFSARDKGTSLEELQRARQALKSKPVVAVKKAGRAGTSKIARSRAGVPVYDMKKLKTLRAVPALDIGLETLISKEDFTLPKMRVEMESPQSLKPLPKALVVTDKEISLALSGEFKPAMGPRGLLANMRPVAKPVTLERVQAVQYKIADVSQMQLKPYQPLSDEEIKMVSALILFERGGHCHMIMGLFQQIAEAEKTKIEASYHLGACAAQLGMRQAAFDKLSQVIKSEDKEFAPLALETLAKDLPILYEKDFYGLMKGLKNFKSLITEKSADEVFYRYAKGAHKAGDFKTSLTMAGMVEKGFKDDADYLEGLNYFAMGDKKNATRKWQELWTSFEARGGGDKNLRALTSTNLARLYFSQKQYPKALDLYMKVPKDHAYWVQALIEQGWTQLALNDSSGAIGNMYSLHSPYFKAVYQPESFVVRSIGYLNICQYGDAYKTLSILEKDYRGWFDKTESFMSVKKDPSEVYETVKTYLKGKSTEDVGGVPFQVLREIGRRKGFLNLQVGINDKGDEAVRYEGVNEKIKKEKVAIREAAAEAKKQFDSIKTKLLTVAKDKAQEERFKRLREDLVRQRELTIAYRYQLALLEISRQGYLAFQSTSQNQLLVVKSDLQKDAARVLNSRLKDIQSEMGKVLGNNEFLRYEVFAGSGENIRYQVAGGAVDGSVNRVPAHVKPTKIMNWNFDGEFWEDEIGSYRSGLHNNCPATGPHEQALLEKGNDE